MKRVNADISSFELFLDTICNTFGGIVFLAILLALTIQTRSVVRTPQSADEQPPTEEEIRQLIAQLDSATNSHAVLAETLRQTPDMGVASADEGYRQLMDELNRKNDAVAERTKQNAEVTRQLAEMFAENTALDTQNAQLREDLAELQQEISQLESDFVSATEAKQETLRLPRVSTSHGSNFIVLLKGSRAYLAFRPVGGFNGDHVTTRDGPGSAIRISPKSGAGWDLTSREGHQRLGQLMDEISGRNAIMTLAVWPDTYEKFSQVKDQLIEQSIPYQIWLEGDDPFLTVFRGSGAATVQ